MSPTRLKDFMIENKVSSLIILCAAAVLFFGVGQMIVANTDYICTHVTEENDPCSNGSWSDWQPISTNQTTGACSVQQIDQRIYTGTRITRQILQYLNLRTACDGSFSSAVYGSGMGASGFHGGTVFTDSAACQIAETRTTYSGNASSTCSAMQQITSVQTDTASSSMQTATLSSLQQLNDYRASLIKAKIWAIPALVHSGQTTNVHWQGVEAVSCEVVGSNGDHWGYHDVAANQGGQGGEFAGNNGTGVMTAQQSVSGDEVSSPIVQQTTYTLTCKAFNGTTMTGSTIVNIIPTWQEQ